MDSRMDPNPLPAPSHFQFLSARYRAQRQMRRGLLDGAPLVDVVLLVLLFIIINSSFVLQPAISMDLPESEFVDGASYGSLVVTLAQEGMVFCNDERTTVDGLASVFAQAVHDDPEAGLVIEADARIEHGTLVRIYNMAVAAGIQRVSLATREPVGAAINQ